MQFADLNAEQTAALQYERGFLTAVLEARFPDQASSGDVSDDLSLIQLVVDNGPYTEDPAEELEALGTSLGDILAAKLDLHWVAYTDENGENLGLRYGDRSIVICPGDILIQRAEHDEEINIHALFEQLCTDVRKMIDSHDDQ